MKSIEVKSLPLDEVIKDIAHEFDIPFSHHCGIYYLQLPKNIGKGYIKGINFEGGLGIIIYDCKFKDDLAIKFTKNQVHPLKFIYCQEGVVQHKFANEENFKQLDKYQDGIVASKNHNGHVLFFQKNTRIIIGSLEIDRKKFKQKMDCDLKNFNSELKKLFLDDDATNAFYYRGFYSLEIADLFNEINKYEEHPFIHKLFLEGKTFQILTSQILQYQDDSKTDENRSLLRPSEINLIHKAARMIEHNVSTIENINAIAEAVGLNVNKLQEGFKYLYKSTVNAYIHKIRLDLAKNLLINTEYNISEIVERIGLSSKSYFSKIFKEEYDISPSDFRQNNRKILKEKLK